MTGYNSKRSAAQDKLTDEADTLTIVYQQGFADGKRSAQRKPLTEEQQVGPIEDMMLRRAALRSAKIVFDGRFVTKQAEPVAQVHPNHLKQSADGNPWCREVLLYSGNHEGDLLNGENYRVKLYTVPPQRPWVGLTDEEIDDIYWGAGKHDLLDARAIETKLKERNT